jgi:hypothetical protein
VSTSTGVTALKQLRGTHRDGHGRRTQPSDVAGCFRHCLLGLKRELPVGPELSLPDELCVQPEQPVLAMLAASVEMLSRTAAEKAETTLTRRILTFSAPVDGPTPEQERKNYPHRWRADAESLVEPWAGPWGRDSSCLEGMARCRPFFAIGIVPLINVHHNRSSVPRTRPPLRAGIDGYRSA